MQKRLILALYTVKSNETNLVPLETHNPCLSSSIIFNDSFFDEAINGSSPPVSPKAQSERGNGLMRMN